MPKLKVSLILAIGIMVTLPSCDKVRALAGQHAGNSGPGSPIIISDNSTDLKHKGAAKDFDIKDAGSTIVATVNDNLTVTELECSPNFSGCTQTCQFDPSKKNCITLQKGWIITTFNATGNPVLVVTSADNHTVTGTYNTTEISAQVDTGNASDTGGGTALIDSADAFLSATLANPSSTTLTCSGTPCKLKIHYQ